MSERADMSPARRDATPRQGPGRLRRLLVPALLIFLGAGLGLGAAYIRPMLSELPGEPMDLEVVDGLGYALYFFPDR